MHRHRPSVPHERRTQLAAALAIAAALGPVLANPEAVEAQTASTPPDTVAAEYLRAFQSMAWAGLAQRLHPDALAYLRLAVQIRVDADTTGWALARLVGAESRAAYDARGDGDVFTGVMGWVQANAAGLLSSLVSRDAELIGVVVEDAATAHAVYRVTTLAQGAEPTVQVATLALTPAGWKVREAPEIRVLHTAVRGIPIPR